jgi:hypothetical protein
MSFKMQNFSSKHKLQRSSLIGRTNIYIRLLTRTPLDTVTLITNLRTLRMHLNGQVGKGNAT